MGDRRATLTALIRCLGTGSGNISIDMVLSFVLVLLVHLRLLVLVTKDRMRDGARVADPRQGRQRASLGANARRSDFATCQPSLRNHKCLVTCMGG
jgi:hypothetical protein